MNTDYLHELAELYIEHLSRFDVLLVIKSFIVDIIHNLDIVDSGREIITHTLISKHVSRNQVLLPHAGAG